MSTRKDHRTSISLLVTIRGLDSNGRFFKQNARTIDITTTGARLKGITCLLHRGANIGVECGTSSARFRVVWVGAGKCADQIGIEILEPGKFIWGIPVPRKLRLATPNETP